MSARVWFDRIREAVLRGTIFQALLQAGLFQQIVSVVGIIAVSVIAGFSGLALQWKIIIPLIAFAAVPTGVHQMAKIVAQLRHKFFGRSSEKYFEWQNKHNELAGHERIAFYNAIDEAYESWCAGKNGPQDFSQLMRETEFPEDLPLAPEQEFIELDIAKGLSEPSKQLVAFISELYPPSRSQSTELLDQDRYRDFDTARRKLSKFWNDFARAFLDFKDLSDRDVETNFPTPGKELRLLTYLEWALARRLGSEGQGKHWMFELYRWAQKKGKAR
jgi:hypothetical protein